MSTTSFETPGFETLDLAIDAGVATITLNRPDAANSLNLTMGRELSEAALICDGDPDVRAVILTGTGKMFCAGGDLGEMAQADSTRNTLMQMAGDLHMALSRLARGDAPVIAAVNGTAAGAGFSMVLATDLAIASSEAKFTMAYTNAGLSPDGSSTFYGPRRLGDRRARELMLTNRVLTAIEAKEWGVVTDVVDPDEVLPAAQKLAARLASGPTRAFGRVKSLLNESFEHSLEAQMELESRSIADMSVSADGQEGISAFLAKRKPEFTGR